MGYIVNIQTGSRSRNNFTRSQSIPLSNKEKVRRWIARNPVGNLRTKVTIRNILTKKTITTTKAGGSIFGSKLKDEIRRRSKTLDSPKLKYQYDWLKARGVSHKLALKEVDKGYSFDKVKKLLAKNKKRR